MNYYIDDINNTLTCRKLVKFLKKEKIYDKFLFYLKQNYENPNKDFCDKKRSFTSAFNFHNTKEGYLYWFMYKDKWLNYKKNIFNLF